MQIGILISSDPKGDAFAGADRLVEAAEKAGHTATKFYESGFTFHGDGERLVIVYEGELLAGPEVFVYRPNFIEEPSLHAHVPHLLMQAGFRVFNGHARIQETKNKLAQHVFMHEAGLPLPRWAIAKRKELALAAAEEIGFPVVLKTPFGTHGVGVFLAENAETLQPIVDYLAISDGNPAILERFVAEANRSDVRVFIVGGRVVASMVRTAPPGDIRANAALGGVGSPTTLFADEERVALACAKLFELDIAGVDLLRTPGGPLLIEVNANPGFKELERVTGIDVVGAIVVEAVRVTES